ncbi:hypothetical protein BYT27DRAFT_7104001, partial [Phlegmacium glaucopus]
PKAGRHFFLARYSIQIIAAANTCVAWKLSAAHRTSFQDLDAFTENPSCVQTALSIVTLHWLPRV